MGQPMNRTIKDYQERRNEILTAAQVLFFSNGYQDTSVQQIIDAVGIAKGTFYYYFDSKVDLLDALAASMAEQQLQVAQTILDEPGLDAAQQLERIFAELAGWKTDRRNFFLDILPTWYSDENVIVRYKLTGYVKHSMRGLMAQVIRLGVEQGIFNTFYPEHIGDIILDVLQNTSEQIAFLILNKGSKGEALHRLDELLEVNQFAVNRLLGAQPGTVQVFVLDRIKLWLE
jgi:AcrR family transcriptional regulator